MGLKGVDNRIKKDSSSYLENCVKSRYLYLQLISKLPWLVSTEEIIPGYPGSVIASRIAYDKKGNSGSMLDCLASKDKDSQECSKSGFGNLSLYYTTQYNNVSKFSFFQPNSIYSEANPSGARLGYICPSCFVAYNKDPSKTKMIGEFIEWFNKLEKPQRNELMSILGDEQVQRNNRRSMIEEANSAWYEYTAIRKRLAEEEKERRRRELLGE